MASRGLTSIPGECKLVRDLSYRQLNGLASILDCIDGKMAGWERLIAEMPKGTYDSVQIGTFRLAQLRLSGSPTYDLLTDMGYRGRTVAQLISYLEKIENEKALELLKPPEAPRIVKQPTVGIAPEDTEIQLECFAVALPFAQYRWFRGKQPVEEVPGEVSGARDRLLTFKRARPHHNGQYCCRALNKMGHIFSNWVEVRVIANPPRGAIDPLPQVSGPHRQPSVLGAPRITQHPRSTSVQEGDQCVLSCEAAGNASLVYRWFKNGVEMPNGQGTSILFQPVHPADAGQYLCKVTNAVGEDVSNTANLQVVPSGPGMERSGRSPSVAVPHVHIDEAYVGREVTLVCGGDIHNVIWFKDDKLIEGASGVRQWKLPRVQSGNFGQYSCKSISGSSVSQHNVEVSVVPPFEPQTGGQQYTVSTCRGKVALLIGNQKYLSAELTTLRQPHNDVQALAGQLTSLGFHCVTLIDASKKEMEHALEFFEYLLVSGVHALFYFAGHGFEENGENYLVPVDVHEGFSLQECIKAQYILRVLQDHDTALNFLILDMCRKAREESSSAQQSCPQPLHNRANTIISYACNPQYDAYESKHIASDNGIFMTHFLRHISEVKRVEDLLMNVNTAVYNARPEAVVEDKWQKPTFISSLAHRVSLHDQVVYNDPQYPSDNQFSDSMRLWERAHTIPPPVNLEGHDYPFHGDGLKLKLIFESEFSNVLLIRVHVVHPTTVTNIHVSITATGSANKLSTYHVIDLQNQGYSTMSSERTMSSSSAHSSMSFNSSRAVSGVSQGAVPPFLFKIEKLQRIRGNVNLMLHLQYMTIKYGTSRHESHNVRTTIDPPLIAKIYQLDKGS